ncbi:MAG: helix-hairpin-helix domain-containing protein [Flavobacteriales bacterium]|nr:helix-hairpin-helix domain-containing protein [Flavobacteriales bacterium]
MLELIAERQETEEFDLTTVLDQVQYLYEHPLNINRADRLQLQFLPFLDDFQVQALLDHRKNTGRILSMYELQGVEGFDLRQIEIMAPFVRLGSNEVGVLKWSQVKSGGAQEAILRTDRFLERQRGYGIDNGYVGRPERLYARYRFRYADHISAGVTLEKDAGEPFGGPGLPLGFDHQSGHIYVANVGHLHQLAMGDFQAQFGQGLTQWSGMAFGRSGDIMRIKRSARGIVPFTSADENAFLRGGALGLRFDAFDVTAFMSKKRVDANVDIDTIKGEEAVRSFQRSGLHATRSQIDSKDAVGETIIGGHARYQHSSGGEFGFTSIYTGYQWPLLPPEKPYQRFSSRSRDLLVSGFDYQCMYRNFLFFGEASLQWGAGVGTVNGVLVSLEKGVGISLLHRYYAASYQVPMASPIAEGGASNERGIYLGLNSKFNDRWSLNGFIDLFTFPWLRYRVDAPSDGLEAMVQLSYRPNRSWSIYSRIRFETKGMNGSQASVTYPISERSKTSCRLHWQCDMGESLSLRGRIEWSVYTHSEQYDRGMLLYQDVIWKPPFPVNYSLKIRFAVFDVEDYSARLYAYEHDVLYASSVPAYYGRGCRFYLLYSHSVSKWCTMSARIAQTYYSDRLSNGSGLGEVSFPRRTQVKLQIRFKL